MKIPLTVLFEAIMNIAIESTDQLNASEFLRRHKHQITQYKTCHSLFSTIRKSLGSLRIREFNESEVFISMKKIQYPRENDHRVLLIIKGKESIRLAIKSNEQLIEDLKTISPSCRIVVCGKENMPKDFRFLRSQSSTTLTKEVHEIELAVSRSFKNLQNINIKQTTIEEYLNVLEFRYNYQKLTSERKFKKALGALLQ